MSTDPNGFERFLHRLAEAGERIDAEVEKVLHDPQYAVPTWGNDADPFGMDWVWENPDGGIGRGTTNPKPSDYPLSPDERPIFEAAYAELNVLPLTELQIRAGETIRTTTLAGGLAGGATPDLLREWAESGFAALCFSRGERGRSLLERIEGSDRDAQFSVTSDVVGFLRQDANFTHQPLASLSAVALAVVFLLRRARDPAAEMSSTQSPKEEP